MVAGLPQKYHCSDTIVENENEITKYMVTKNFVTIDMVYEI